MDRRVDCEVGMDSGTCSYGFDKRCGGFGLFRDCFEIAESRLSFDSFRIVSRLLGIAARSYSIGSRLLHFLSLFIASLCNTVVFNLPSGNRGPLNTTETHVEYDQAYQTSYGTSIC